MHHFFDSGEYWRFSLIFFSLKMQHQTRETIQESQWYSVIIPFQPRFVSLALFEHIYGKYPLLILYVLVFFSKSCRIIKSIPTNGKISTDKVIFLNQFHTTGLFVQPLKTSENQRFSDIFFGYRKRPHCVKCVRIRSFSEPYFLSPNAGKYGPEKLEMV